MAFFHGPTSWSNFRGLISYEIQLTKNLDPLTKCKPNVNQEEWPFTAKVNVLIYFSHMSKKGTLEEHTYSNESCCDQRPQTYSSGAESEWM